MRLVNGASSHEGRLEVYYNGAWGTVCDDSFDQVDAQVVCGQLGFTNTVATVAEYGLFGEGVDPIWLAEVACDGTENQLSECGHRGWGDHNCAHSEDVGVVCLQQGESFVNTNDAIAIEQIDDRLSHKMLKQF